MGVFPHSNGGVSPLQWGCFPTAMGVFPHIEGENSPHNKIGWGNLIGLFLLLSGNE